MPSFFSSSVNGMPLLIRADFTDQLGWDDVCRAVGVDRSDSDDDVQVEFSIVEDPAFEGLTPARLLDLEPDPHGTFFVVDEMTFTHPERPLLAVDVYTEPGTSFRLIPAEVQGFAVNMLIANMDFADFGDNVDPDGIFRGFGPPIDPARTGTPVHPHPPVSAGGGPVGVIADVIAEADPDDPDSFIGQLIRDRFWNPASWQRLEAGMREACRRYDGVGDVPRALTAAFHSVLVRAPNLVAGPGMIPMNPGAVEIRLERIRVLSGWFFRGWILDRPDGPLPAEYDPKASHG